MRDERVNIFGRWEPRPAPPGGRIPSEPTRPDLVPEQLEPSETLELPPTPPPAPKLHEKKRPR